MKGREYQLDTYFSNGETTDLLESKNDYPEKESRMPPYVQCCEFKTHG